MFASDEGKRRFMAEPDKYAGIDLVFAGNCVVTKLETQKDVAGKQEFGTVWGGMRYHFTSKANKIKFLQAPDRYVQLEK